MGTWQPITEVEFDKLIEEEIKELNQEERAAFEHYRIKPWKWKATIRRTEIAGDEQVYVVTRCGDEVIYYDDVELGFDGSKVDDQGRLLEPGGSQADLRDTVSSWLPMIKKD